MTVSRKIVFKTGSGDVVSGQYAGLLLVRSWFVAALDFDYILSALGLLRVIRDGEE